MRAEMGSIPHPRLPRLTTPKARKENPIENIPRRELPRRGPLPRLRVRLVCPFAFPSRGSPSQPLKKKQSGTHHFTRKKKNGIQRQNDRVPCSSALGVVFRVRPPYVCKSHDECECERCSKQSALYRCFCVGFLEFLTFGVLAKSTYECLGTFRIFSFLDSTLKINNIVVVSCSFSVSPLSPPSPPPRRCRRRLDNNTNESIIKIGWSTQLRRKKSEERNGGHQNGIIGRIHRDSFSPA